MQQGVCAMHSPAPALRREKGGPTPQVRLVNLAGVGKVGGWGMGLTTPRPQPPCRVGKPQVKIRKRTPHLFWSTHLLNFCTMGMHCLPSQK